MFRTPTLTMDRGAMMWRMRSRKAGLFMSMFLALGCLQLSAFGAHAGDVSKGLRLALVIGNAQYDSAPDLGHARADAMLVAQALGRAGFSVTPLHDGTRKQMEDALAAFQRKLGQQEAEAGLIYYAGHGAQLQGRNYLIPVDAGINEANEADARGIEVGSLLDALRQAKAWVNIVILDTSRNNPFGGTPQGINRGLAPVDPPPGTCIAYSTAPGSVADGGEKAGNGHYAAALAAAIDRPGLSIDQLFKTVRRTVFELSEAQQVPWNTSSIVGDFYFHPP
jgi:uncharacterized caspase-like protein